MPHARCRPHRNAPILCRSTRHIRLVSRKAGILTARKLHRAQKQENKLQDTHAASEGEAMRNPKDPRKILEDLPIGRSWRIAVNEDYVSAMLRANNETYHRRTGRGYFFFCLALVALELVTVVKALADGMGLDGYFAYWVDLVGSPVAAVACLLIFPALAAFFGFMALAPGKTSKLGKKKVMRELLDTLRADGDGAMTACLGEYGIALCSGSQTMHVPYALCSSTTDIDGVTFVRAGDRNSQSVLYNMLGNNAYFRDSVGFSFSAPGDIAPLLLQAGEAQLARAAADEDYCAQVGRYIDSGA